MTTPTLWQTASAFAARAHHHDLRNDGRTPYFSHTARVALTVAAVFDCTDETVLAGALLHDVLEDTKADYDDLDHHFGRRVADIVASLSKDKRLIEPTREQEYDQRLESGLWEAKLIKLADVYDNLADADSDEARRRMLARVDRVVAVAGADQRLQPAVDVLKRLADSTRQKMDSP